MNTGTTSKDQPALASRHSLPDCERCGLPRGAFTIAVTSGKQLCGNCYTETELPGLHHRYQVMIRSPVSSYHQ